MFMQRIKSIQRRMACMAAIGQFSLVLFVLLDRFGERFLPASFPTDFLTGFFTGLCLVFNLAFLVTYSKYARSQNGG
jgi:hypothetical protein